MLIYCSKCNTRYDIDASLIPEKGKKVRCSNCGEVFICFPQDLTTKEEPKTVVEEKLSEVPVETTQEVEVEAPKPQADSLPEEDDDMQEIFKRLSEQTENLFKVEKELSPLQKICLSFKRFFGLSNALNRIIFLSIIAFFMLLVLYYARFGIVRQVPFLGMVYKIFGVNAVVIGEGLEFQNITRNEFEEDFIRKLEVKGFVVNLTDKEIKIPTIKVEMLDDETRFLHSILSKAPVDKVGANSRIAFSIVVSKPSPLTKFVYLTFVEPEE